ncbi:MAG: PQQ-dependent sugar dehydrogenase [Verrucomicrobia bacterium]|nr:PQQ-dependent sugar dehydrogenase [Verrucomicrobiota bacterium]
MSVLKSLLSICAVCLGVATGFAQSVVPLRRDANVTLRMPEKPPVFGFTTARAFGSLRFTDPMAMVTPPGETNRLFVVEQRGRIAVVTNLLAPTRTVFLDISSRVTGGVPADERGLLGLAFHPGYATNRYFFVAYTTGTGGAAGRLSRFETDPSDPSRALATSELILINQPDEASNHNGGDLHFGPDGYLYYSLGDEGGANDQYANSQRIDKDFFAGILRIDVDKRPGSLPPNPHAASRTNNYTVPPDNPFVGATNFLGRPVDPARVRTEFYAVGLRNPWRMSFDRPTGRLYVGDVGQDRREEINLIVKGGNYGWNYREGLIAGPRATPAGFSHINPIFDYPRNQGVSVTGGLVYRGNRFSQLYGRYIFADYGTGNIWGLLYDGSGSTNVTRLAVDRDIVGFGVDPSNGDVLLADVGEDAIKRLIYSTNTTGVPLPPLLSETGAFADLAKLTPQSGIVPYEINVPFWSDYAQKRRWFSVPDPAKKISFSREGNWSFPMGAVWIKHFELEIRKGAPESARRLETRFIVRNSDGVYGVTYKWDEDQQNARLVPEDGLDEPLVINDGGILRTQIWHYPSRSECLACHTPVAGHALGFKTEQLNRDFNYGNTAANQIRALSGAGYFDAEVAGVNTLLAAAHPADDAASLEHRVRSYLAANCSQCHQPGGSALGQWDARLTTRTAESGLINGLLVNDRGNPEARSVKPGSIEHSMLLKRISARGAGQMPPIASTEVDAAGVALLSAWITNDLPKSRSFAEWQRAHFELNTSPIAGASEDPDDDGASNYQEYLVGTDPLLDSDVWRVTVERDGDKVRLKFPRIANRGFEVQFTTDLFNPASWKPLDVPANRLFFSATNSAAAVEDSIPTAQAKYYRVRVFEP